MSDFQAFAVRQACLSPPLRPNPTQLGKAASTTSLIKQKGLEDAWGVEHLPAMMNPLEAMINPFEAMNYLRPSNQLVLLLQKGVPFPVFPPELAECVSERARLCVPVAQMSLTRNHTSWAIQYQIDERTWQKRMEELHTALSRYWSWVEKALFAFAFIASITAVSDSRYKEMIAGSRSPPPDCLTVCTALACYFRSFSRN